MNSISSATIDPDRHPLSFCIWEKPVASLARTVLEKPDMGEKDDQRGS
jgi:hypothetical protein